MTTPDTPVRVTEAAFLADPAVALRPLKDGVQVVVTDKAGRTVLVVGSRGLDLGIDYDDPAFDAPATPLTADERQAAIDRWLT